MELKFIKKEIALFPIKEIDNFTDFYTHLVNNISDFNNDFSENNASILKGMLPEIPRIVLKSGDQNIVLQVTSSRINILFIKNIDDTTKINTLIENIIKSLKESLHLTPEQASINRVGNITQNYFQTNDFINNLKTDILNGELRNKLDSLYFQLTYIVKIAEVKCNKVISISNAFDDDGNKVNIIQEDLNTHQENTLAWGLNEILKFIEDSNSEFELNTKYSRFFE